MPARFWQGPARARSSMEGKPEGPMAQVFKPHANLLARSVLLGLAVALAAVAAVAVVWARSEYANEEGRVVEQPVPFSHEHHVGGLGIDCRYCHTVVEKSEFAGIPSTETCMTCHSQLWTSAPMLEPVRESLRRDEPIRWRRVHDLADFVYFNHSIHVAKGVGCETCHGRVDEMPMTRQAAPLTMGWCLECHRDPAPFLRPKEKVFEMGWEPPEGSRRAVGEQLVELYAIHTRQLTDCTVCHR